MMFEKNLVFFQGTVRLLRQRPSNEHPRDLSARLILKLQCHKIVGCSSSYSSVFKAVRNVDTKLGMLRASVGEKLPTKTPVQVF